MKGLHEVRLQTELSVVGNGLVPGVGKVVAVQGEGAGRGGEDRPAASLNVVL